MAIAAWSGAETRRTKARLLLSDPMRTLVGSDMLALELLPHATYGGNAAEVRFMSGFLERVRAVAIESAGVEQFVTTENRTKPMYRIETLQVVHLDDL